MPEFISCGHCSRIVKVIREGRGDLICCGEPMKPLASFRSMDSALEFAIEKEAEARDFYLEWAGKVEAANLGEILRGLAGEEQKHRERLERVRSGSSFKPSAAKVTDLMIVDYLVDAVPSPGMDYQQALVIAMRREKASFKLYSDLAAASGDEDLRSLFLALSQEEARHKLRLETEYEKDVYREN